jgi:hypothetical protein
LNLISEAIFYKPAFPNFDYPWPTKAVFINPSLFYIACPGLTIQLGLSGPAAPGFTYYQMIVYSSDVSHACYSMTGATYSSPKNLST